MHIYMPLIILMKLTSSHSTPLTHLISLNSSHLCSYIYFFIFIYPSPICFFIKLLTCGVIRSYNSYIIMILPIIYITICSPCFSYNFAAPMKTSLCPKLTKFQGEGEQEGCPNTCGRGCHPSMALWSGGRSLGKTSWLGGIWNSEVQTRKEGQI